MAGSVAVIWPTPFGVIEQLQLLPGGSNSDALYCSSDGQTVVGWADDASGTQHAVKWDKTTLAVTQLPNLGVVPAFAFACSPDGSIIFASDGSQNHITRYTGGGSGGAVLAPTAGDGPTFYPEWWVRYCSDDGVFALGSMFTVSNSHNNTPARYAGTVPTLLPKPTPLPPFSQPIFQYIAYCISADGTVIVGNNASAQAMFWRGTTAYRLNNPSSYYLSGAAEAQPRACNADGSIIWGHCCDDTLGTPPDSSRACYWDNLTTLNADGSYGTVHFLNLPGSGSFIPFDIPWVAETTASPICVSYVNTSSARYGAKWTGTTLTMLSALAGGTDAQAHGCSADGVLVVGQSDDATSSTWAAYWNTAVDTTPHKLPTLPLEILGIAHGASRNASLIYGRVTLVDVVSTTLTDAELLFSPTSSFMDLSVEANRRLFVASGGTPQWMGSHGALAFGGDIPQVYLTTLGPPTDFTQNNGAGGSFGLSGSIDPADGPGCSPYYITEAAGPASRPEWRLTVSDDGSRTWSRLVKPREIGVTGAYKTRLRWLKMGQFRQRVIKLECTDPVRRNIIGIYMDNEQGSV